MHVFITGASSGIGEALGRELHKRGAHVTLVARRKDKLDHLVSELGSRAFAIEADLTDPKKAEASIAPAEAHAGPIDVLINNAGVQIVANAHETDPDAGEALLSLNVATPLRLIRHVLPAMIARGKGTIVNVASMAALSPVPGMLYYNASKGGLANASEALVLAQVCPTTQERRGARPGWQARCSSRGLEVFVQKMMSLRATSRRRSAASGRFAP